MHGTPLALTDDGNAGSPRQTVRDRLEHHPHMNGILVVLGMGDLATFACEADHALIAGQRLGLKPSNSSSLGVVDQAFLHDRIIRTNDP